MRIARAQQAVIEIIIDADANHAGIPAMPGIEQAVLAACSEAGFPDCPELCVRFAADETIRTLNRQWRGLDEVTDVLSFPMQEGPDYDFNMPLGDIALAVQFIHQEAILLDLRMQDHVLHLIVHAVLHLLGFDHMRDEEAKAMQKLEQRVMLCLGLHDPHPNHSTAEHV
jgi:probable rRNA maturation factor